MPHLPDIRTHQAHDPELIAAYAAGDASGDALATASALVTGCAECAALHRDLRAIATATAVLPAPARPRDFRLTAEQAASLRPAGLRGVLATLAGPRFGFAAPLGSVMATLGLAGILVAGGGLPLGAGGTASPDTAYQAAVEGTGEELASGSGIPEPALAAPQPGASGVPPREVPAADDLKTPAATPEMDTAAGRSTAAPAASGAPGTLAGPTEAPPSGALGPTAAAGSGQPERLAVEPTTGPNGDAAGTMVPMTFATLVLLAGVTLLVVRVGARRIAR